MSSWQPSASLANLRKRAEVLQTIRQFFAARSILEVETPLLSHATVTDLHIQSIAAEWNGTQWYLQTSPEYAMKRLLAAGSGAIFQICKAFRQDPSGRIHNPEFTMLEWYRPGYDHHALMDEMNELLQQVLSCPPAKRMTYRQIFQEFLSIDPHVFTVSQLQQCAEQQGMHLAAVIEDKDTWLDLLFTHCIEPKIGFDQPMFVYDFPASQAALAKVRHEQPPVASRFEVYIHGMELANGFHELQDAEEQRRRFQKDLDNRAREGLATLPMDENLLAALAHGLPDCAGVALGIDRLVMIAAGCARLEEVISFDAERA